MKTFILTLFLACISISLNGQILNRFTDSFFINKIIDNQDISKVKAFNVKLKSLKQFNPKSIINAYSKDSSHSIYNFGKVYNVDISLQSTGYTKIVDSGKIWISKVSIDTGYSQEIV